MIADGALSPEDPAAVSGVLVMEFTPVGQGVIRYQIGSAHKAPGSSIGRLGPG